MMDKLEARLKQLCDGENLPLFEQVYRGLVDRYNESHRFYHNLDHIRFCLDLFDKVKNEIDDPIALELAIWYHDVIYDTRSPRNEEESADFAVKELTKLKFPKSILSKIHGLILVTKHTFKPTLKDENFLLDIDLAILGSETPVFKKYEANIRKEYAWVDEIVYRKKRTEVLTNFFVKKRLFRTHFFLENFEQKAKQNLEAAINTLVHK